MSDYMQPIGANPGDDIGGFFRCDGVPGEPDVWMDYSVVVAVTQAQADALDGRREWEAPEGCRPGMIDGRWFWVPNPEDRDWVPNPNFQRE